MGLMPLCLEHNMTIESIIALCHKHMSCTSSQHCLCQALALLGRGDPYGSARMWAIKSLAYSVGVFHPDYQLAARA